MQDECFRTQSGVVHVHPPDLHRPSPHRFGATLVVGHNTDRHAPPGGGGEEPDHSVARRASVRSASSSEALIPVERSPPWPGRRALRSLIAPDDAL
ncbi:unnamed protein product [Boreogadus saida]